MPGSESRSSRSGGTKDLLKKAGADTTVIRHSLKEVRRIKHRAPESSTIPHNSLSFPIYSSPFHSTLNFIEDLGNHFFGFQHPIAGTNLYLLISFFSFSPSGLTDKRPQKKASMDLNGLLVGLDTSGLVAGASTATTVSVQRKQKEGLDTRSGLSVIQGMKPITVRPRSRRAANQASIREGRLFDSVMSLPEFGGNANKFGVSKPRAEDQMVEMRVDPFEAVNSHLQASLSLQPKAPPPTRHLSSHKSSKPKPQAPTSAVGFSKGSKSSSSKSKRR